MPQVEPKVEDIFHAALELVSPEARSAFLDQACGSAELRRKVERLLDLDLEENSFLRAPALIPTETTAPDSRRGVEEPGAVIGPYKLLEVIGEGGMGTVYMAEQSEPVRRRVALKVIKPGMDSKQVVARFEAERQALAMMDHPNIARVFDGGMAPSGRPYFVMELVRGLPITEYCDAEKLSIPERLDLFVLVCRAVQHAHQKGVIHRDLKPSNILVTVIDGAAVPKVIDFGVAKATGQALTEKTLFTGFHQFVGTPLYVSPEQAELSGADVDTRSDIYSLGVLLYELLTGTTPFDSETLKRAAFDEMRRIIREEEPPKPSARLSTLGATLSTISAQRKADPRRLGPSLRGELDWVVMKALEKDRGRRYETANDFAADIMRFLTDRPVRACPPSASYRFGKFARRNRVALVTTGLVGVSLIAGTVLSTWQAITAQRARRDAVAALIEVDARRREARRAVDAMYSRLAEQWLEDQPHLKPLQREFLQEALGFYRSFARNRAVTQGERAEAAVAYQRVGRIESAFGRADESRAAYDEAIVLLRGLVEEQPDSARFRYLLAKALDGYGGHAWRSGAFDEAQRLAREAVENGLQLVERFPDDAEHALLLARSQGHLGVVLLDAGRRDQADAEFRAAIDRLRSLAASRKGDADLEHSLSDLLNNHAQLVRDQGRLGDAETALRESLRSLRAATAAAPDRPQDRVGFAYRHVNLGELLQRTNRPTDAEAEFRRAVELFDLLSREFPEIPDHRHDLAKAQAGLATALRAQGRIKPADEALATSMNLRESLVRDFPDHLVYRKALAGALNARGIVLAGAQRPRDAEVDFRRVVDLGEELVTRYPDVITYRSDLALALNNLALVLKMLGRAEEAEHVVRRSVVAYEQAGDAERQAMALSSLGIILKDLGRLDDAAVALVRSRELWAGLAARSEHPADAHHNLGAVWNTLTQVCRGRGDLAEARRCLEKAVAEAREALKQGPRNPTYRLFLRNHYWLLTEILAALGDHVELVRVDGEMRAALPENGLIPALVARGLIELLPSLERDANLSPDRRRERSVELADLIRARIDEARRLGAEDPEALTLLGRILANSPDERFRDLPTAVVLAGSATRLAPQDAEAWSCLGLACYRAGAFAEAERATRRAMELKSGGGPDQWLIGALVAHAQGEVAEARSLQERSLARLKNRPAVDPELSRLRDEVGHILAQTPSAPKATAPAGGSSTSPK